MKGALVMGLMATGKVEYGLEVLGEAQGMVKRLQNIAHKYRAYLQAGFAAQGAEFAYHAMEMERGCCRWRGVQARLRDGLLLMAGGRPAEGASRIEMKLAPDVLLILDGYSYRWHVILVATSGTIMLGYLELRPHPEGEDWRHALPAVLA